MEGQIPQILEQSTRDLLLLKPLIPIPSPKLPPSPVSPSKLKPPPSLREFGKKLTMFIGAQLRDSVNEGTPLKFSESDIHPEKILLTPPIQAPPPLINREERNRLVTKCEQLLNEKQDAEYEKTIQSFFHTLKQQEPVDQINVLIKLMQAHPNTNTTILGNLIKKLDETYTLHLQPIDQTGQIKGRLKTFFSYFKISTPNFKNFEHLSLENSLLQESTEIPIDTLTLKSPHSPQRNYAKNSVYDWEEKKTIVLPSTMTCFVQTAEKTLKIGTSNPAIITFNTSNDSSVESKTKGIPYAIVPRSDLGIAKKNSQPIVLENPRNNSTLPLCLVAFKKIFVGKEDGKIIGTDYVKEKKITLHSHDKPITGLIALSHQKFKREKKKISKVLVSSSEDNTIKVWDPEKEDLLITMNTPLKNQIKMLTKLTESELLVSLNVSNSIDIWDLNTTQKCKPPEHNPNESRPDYTGAASRIHYKIEPIRSLHINRLVHCILGTRSHLIVGKDGKIDIIDPIKGSFLYSIVDFDAHPVVGLAFTRFNALAVIQQQEKNKLLTLIPRKKKKAKEEKKEDNNS